MSATHQPGWDGAVIADPHHHRVTVTLPPGRMVELAGAGPVFVREVAGPPAAPTLLLLHGWTATADLNCFRVFEPLGQQHGIVAMDLRGHGRGLRTPHRFTLEACADDATNLLAVLGIRRAVVVGYSMGGAIAQLMWRRHPDRTAALVLCSTASTFNATSRERALFAGLTAAAAASRLAPHQIRAMTALRIMTGRPERGLRHWSYGEVARHDWLRIVEAGREIGRFDSRRWVGSIDVPVALTVTLDDEIVPVSRQLALAGSIPGATLHEVLGGHASCINEPRRWVPALMAGVSSVVRRL